MQYGCNDFSASECHFFIASPTLDRITLYARHKRNDMTMHSAYVFCIIFVCFLCARPAQGRVSSNGLRTIPDYLQICRQSDADVNDCVRRAIVTLQPKLATGIPELLVPPCEPLQIPQVTIRQNAGAISMESEYANIEVWGLTNFTLRSVRVAPASHKFRIKLWFPELRMTADYSIHGKLLLLPLAGQGTCHGNFSDVDAAVSIQAAVVQPNGQPAHLRVADLFVDFNIGNADIHLDDLFNGDSELGAAMNQFLNENWQTVAAEMRPALEDAIASILHGMADRFFEAYTMEQLFPE